LLQRCSRPLCRSQTTSPPNPIHHHQVTDPPRRHSRQPVAQHPTQGVPSGLIPQGPTVCHHPSPTGPHQVPHPPPEGDGSY